MRGVFFISLLLLSITSGAQAPDSISAASIEKHVRVLAADSLRGRGNFHPAQAKAARYIAAEFERYGLKPFPFFPGYRQPFIQASGKVVAIDPADALYNNMHNVVGMLKGRTKPQEIVLISAHYDHVGIEYKGGKDSILNGANDNASGTAALLELAYYFALRGDNERTLLFCAFGGEELGLLGSQLVAKLLKPEHVVAQLNIEMIGVPQYGKNKFAVTGSYFSDVAKYIDGLIKGSTSKRVREGANDKKLFYRSDNYPFAARGVPAHTIMTSDDDDDCYHNVCDEAARLDYAHMQSIVTTIASVVVPMAKGEFTPRRIKADRLERYIVNIED